MVTTIVAVDGGAVTGFNEGQQSGRLSAQPIIGTSISAPLGRATSVYSGIVHVPVRRGPPVYGVVGKARKLAPELVMVGVDVESEDKGIIAVGGIPIVDVDVIDVTEGVVFGIDVVGEEAGVVDVEVLLEVVEVVDVVDVVEVWEVVVDVGEIVVDVVVEQNDGATTFPGLTRHPLVTRATPAEAIQSY